MTVAEPTVWPSLPLAEWQGTRDTFQLWTQIVGKVRLAHAPHLNHWWQTPLYVTATGLTTSLMPYRSGRSFQIDFDLVTHELRIMTTSGEQRSVKLEPRSVADFYAEVMARLDELDLHTDIWPMPVEIVGASTRFTDDKEHASYDAGYVNRFWRSLVEMDRLFHIFRARFVGKVSPVHLWWGALDLAVTRFSGRPAPPYRQPAPNCGPHVMLEAYSHEVSSCGYWPGGDGEGFFYSYTYPEPDGFRDAAVGPDAASYDGSLGEFMLPYEVVRSSDDPDATLLEFLQTSYEAGADAAGWDRAALEHKP